MAALLCDRWADILKASLTGSWAPAHLGLEQLVKHALALSTHAAGRDAHLVYCYWEPSNGDSVQEVNAHRRELQRLQSKLAGSTLTLHAATYHDLLNEWEGLEPQPPWLVGHVTELRQRYELTL